MKLHNVGTEVRVHTDMAASTGRSLIVVNSHIVSKMIITNT